MQLCQFLFYLLQSNVRTSSLFMPIMALEGHEGDIFATKFHPEGEYLASSGYDRKICKYRFVMALHRYCLIYVKLFKPS